VVLDLQRLQQHLRQNGPIVMSHVAGHSSGDHFAVGSEWGQEAPDSPMAGGAAYGVGETLEEALNQLLSDLGPAPAEHIACPRPWIVNCQQANEGSYCKRLCLEAMQGEIDERVASAAQG
jgi:hypothetical protein